MPNTADTKKIELSLNPAKLSVIVTQMEGKKSNLILSGDSEILAKLAETLKASVPLNPPIAAAELNTDQNINSLHQFMKNPSLNPHEMHGTFFKASGGVQAAKRVSDSEHFGMVHIKTPSNNDSWQSSRIVISQNLDIALHLITDHHSDLVDKNKLQTIFPELEHIADHQQKRIKR